MTTTTATTLRLREVTFAYRAGTTEEVRVLDGVDLEVAPGSLTVVAGRSGSGKTTLLRIASGLILPSSGDVRWGYVALQDLDEDGRARWRRENVGMATQGGGLIDNLTAAENVALPAIGRRERVDNERIDALLGQVRLAHRIGHFPSQLSTGEQQRAAIARALFNDPGLLIADEPTANLDRSNADDVADLLTRLAEDRAVLIATHDPALIERAGRLLTLD